MIIWQILKSLVCRKSFTLRRQEILKKTESPESIRTFLFGLTQIFYLNGLYAIQEFRTIGFTQRKFRVI